MADPMPAQAIVRRKLPSVAYQAGVRQTITLDRDGVLQMVVLRLQYRVSNGATGPTAPKWHALARLLRRVEVVVDGQDTVVSISGAHIASRALLEFGMRQPGTEATVVLTSSAVTDYDIVLPLPFFLPKSRRPDDTSLDLRAQTVSQAILAVTWGDLTDVFTAVNTATLSNVALSIEGHYLVNAAPDAVFMVRSLDVQEVSNPATNASLSALIDRGSDMFWRSFHIATTRNDIAVQNIISGDIRLRAGAFTYVNREARHVLAEAQRNYALPTAEWGTDLQVYRVDMSNLGQGTTLINAAALNGDLFLEFGTTYTSGTETISISREAMRRLRNR
jgi:hypothetical protein